MDSHKSDLDRVDRALLRALSVNARASGAALASEIGVAESTVSLRLRRLQQLGHIRGYRANIDLAALGASLQALIAVRLVRHAREQIDDFRNSAPHWPGVIGMFHVAGADDYLIHVAAVDASDLRDFVLEHLTEHPAVAHTETNLIFEYVDGDGWQDLVG
ncbi:Lrp/AsnC family transcriptional regulator [Cryobacterium tepidiphilum]|jgi:DNA-binding Lrp family transcriptional regulator|uniref:Lrp/AsnC family transcriptional regulator n=1 Tax=Cryobacterium tepidiphilum TaxID=2486026 RepID=A0A3M8LNS6_9MICO|nr:Lrp/AsnC family transcriptional regulator [Cryobacterium tepidiphilum]RNE66469.1 Lrp/AsnC family transcriptional regulator [Cryobacterium tepidiphilum]